MATTSAWQLGCINTGGGWGILIPPSIMMILYAMISGESVGKMFAAHAFSAAYQGMGPSR